MLVETRATACQTWRVFETRCSKLITDCARRIVLLKLTTDKHEASRGLSAKAELLFC